MWTVEVYKTANAYMCLVSLMRPQLLQAANLKEKECCVILLLSDITALSPSGGKKEEVSVMNLLDHSLNWVSESLQGFRFSSWVGAEGFTPDAQSGSKKSLPSWWEPGDDVAKSNSTETTKTGLHYYNTTTLGHLHMCWCWKRCGLCFDKWLSWQLPSITSLAFVNLEIENKCNVNLK